MTDTTDINALREAAIKATQGRWLYSRPSLVSKPFIVGAGGLPVVNLYDGDVKAKDARFIALADPATIIALLDQLEAERQQREAAEKLNPLSVNVSELEATYIGDIRLHMAAISDWKKRAEAAEKERDDLKAAHGNMVSQCALLRQRTDLPVDRIPAYNSLVKAQEEIAALKGEQVPVAWRHDSDILCHKVVTMSEVVAKSWVDKGRSVTPLYDRPQKPVVLPPLKTRDDYQSRLGNGDIGPYNHGHLEGWNAAIGAAGGWVCTSDERLMQDMSGIVAEPHFRENSNSSTRSFRENLETSTNCPKCGGRGSYHCPQMLGTVECECGALTKAQNPE